jgi:AraC-like DNA-binding protein
MVKAGAKMLTYLPPNSPFRHPVEVPQSLARPIAEPRDFTSQVVHLLDDARQALGSDREAAKASLARASALLQDATDRGKSRSIDAPPAAVRGGLAQWQIRRVMTHIETYLMTSISVADLSAITRLSKSHFSRAFRASVGEPVHAYIIRRRMERAQQLMLTTDQPLCQIALDCGLSDQAHFSRLFRRVVGVSPNVWRRQWRADGSTITRSHHPVPPATDRWTERSLSAAQ